MDIYTVEQLCIFRLLMTQEISTLTVKRTLYAPIPVTVSCLKCLDYLHDKPTTTLSTMPELFFYLSLPGFIHQLLQFQSIYTLYIGTTHSKTIYPEKQCIQQLNHRFCGSFGHISHKTTCL